MKRFLSMAAVLVCGAAAFAQYTNVLENGTNLTVSTAWTNDAVWVGQTTSSNTLYVVTGGAVTSSNLYVGASGNANGNAVSVEGGSWTIEETLEIGPGANNSVSVGGGGILAAGELVIYSNNTFNLNDQGTFAIATDFDASMAGFNWKEGGHLSVGGELTGMTVTNSSVYLDGGRDLTLNGGTWQTGSTNLVVGDGSAGSDLIVTNGGWANVGTGSTNDYAMDPDGGILVGGTNGASLWVENGSSVLTTGGLYVGGTNAGLAGIVTITNGGSVEAGTLAIGNPGSSLSIENGGTLSITGDFDADAQTNVSWNSGGMLSVGGTLTKSSGLAGAGRTLEIEGGAWNLGGDLSVAGNSNVLVVANGGSVTNDNGYVGAGTSNFNNTVTVAGDGSVWLNNGSLTVGSANGSVGNAVTVSDGGRIEADDLFIADGNSFNLASEGTLAIAGDFDLNRQGSLVWSSGGMLSVGGDLSGLSVTNLAANGVTNAFAYLDGGRDIKLDGGSLQLGTTNLIVGYKSAYSDLIIANGAEVSNADGYIGWGGSAGNNSVRVTGAGSAWTNSGGHLYVGAYWSGTNIVNAGAGNRLAVEDGAWVNVGEVATNLAGGSMLVASTNGAQLVVGLGTVEVEGTLYLGLATNLTGTASIRSGGTVAAGDLKLASGSLLDLQSGGTFAIAADFDASTGGFSWNDGGHISVGGILTGMTAAGATNYLDGGRDLTLDGGTWNLAGNDLVVGFNDSGSELTVNNGGVLSSVDAFIGWGTNAADNRISVEQNGMWNNSGDLWIGYSGSDSALSISSSGTVSVAGNAYIGNTDASVNTASVAGPDSVLSIGGDLVIGGMSNSVNNSLSVSGAGQVQVDGGLTLRSGNAISLASGGSIAVGSTMGIYSNATIGGAGSITFGETNAALAFYGGNISLSTGIVFAASSNYANSVSVYDGIFTVAGTNDETYVNFQNLALGDSTLNGSGLLDFANISMNGGTIDPAGDGIGRIEMPGVVSLDGATYRAQVISNQWDQLVFSGTNQVDLSTVTAGVYVPYIPTATNEIVILSAADIAGGFGTTNMDVRPLLYDGELLLTNNEVRVVMVPVETGTIGSTLDFAAVESIRAGFSGMKNMVFTRTKQLRRNLVATAHAVPNEVRMLTDTNAPAGAYGPGDQNTIFDSHVWMQFSRARGDYDAVGVSDAFSLYNNGTTIGIDKLVGEGLAVGLNYTYARSAARGDGGDSLDTQTYWVGAYGEWVGVEGLYVDALAGYGYTTYDTERIADNYHGTASYSGRALGASADVGQYYYYGDHMAVSPYLGLHALALMSEAHDEVEDAGSVVRVGEVNHSWLVSSVGLKLRHRFDMPIGRFQTTGYAEWIYDFIQDDVYSSLSSGNLAAAQTAHISPDESGVNTGLGFSWTCTDYMEIGVGYNGRFSDSFEEHAGSLMLDIMF